MTLKKPPEKALIIAVWFLAGLLFALISGIAFYEAKAATLRGDEGLTTQELCKDSCNREHTICQDSSGSRLDSNYGDKNPFVGLSAGCDKDLRECQMKCGINNGRRDPARGSTGN
jgi:hypothetical protein